jgi:hypothetical protein
MPLVQTEDVTRSVGIFWWVQAVGAAPTILADLVGLARAEPYREFLTYGGHYEFWSKISDLSRAELRRQALPDVARWSEHEEWPVRACCVSRAHVALRTEGGPQAFERPNGGADR